MNEENSSIMVPVSLSDEEQEINSDDKIEPVEDILVENHMTNGDPNDIKSEASVMMAVSLSDEEQEINTDDKIEPVEAIFVENKKSHADENHVTIHDPFNGDPNVKESEADETENTNFEKRIEALEQDRGQLAAEVISKDILITNLEKETSSLKSEVTQLETNHANIVAEHERKFLLLSEEMSAKVAEVCDYKYIYFLINMTLTLCLKKVQNKVENANIKNVEANIDNPGPKLFIIPKKRPM